ncbi:hypothetical protein DXO052_05385 [Xanthomonas oryzae pv. oryzae]|nr:hypothetical protein DXO052_05385 [Xanthomonas oryzae pv. oryzae]
MRTTSCEFEPGWARMKSGEQQVASSCQVGADGALRTAVDAWSMPLPSTGRARLAVRSRFASRSEMI